MWQITKMVWSRKQWQPQRSSFISFGRRSVKHCGTSLGSEHWASTFTLSGRTVLPLLDPMVRKAPGWHILNTVWRTEGPSNHLFQALSQCFLWAPNQMDIRNKSSGLDEYSIWRVRLEKLCSHYIFTRHIIKLRRRPPVAPGTDSCSLDIFLVSGISL